jgi:hypothetical protein
MNAEKEKFATEHTENAEVDIFKKNLLCVFIRFHPCAKTFSCFKDFAIAP